MRKLGWLSVASVIGTLLVAATEPSSGSNGLLNCLPRSLWVFSFSCSIVSISLLVGNLVLGRLASVGFPGKLLSWAYLSIGPSLALLSVSTWLGIAMPAWVSYVSPAILPLSAWAFYRSLGPLEEGGPGTFNENDQAENENWITGIGPHPSGAVQNLQ